MKLDEPESIAFHGVASLFPLMSAEEYAALKEDIAANGLREPIWTYHGKVIDGRNRYRACVELGIKPAYREWAGGGSLVRFVVSLNLARRHLSSSQKAMIAREMKPMLAAEAEEQRRAKISHYRRTGKTRETTQTFGASHANEAAEQAAKIGQTNRQYLSEAEKLYEQDFELAEAVKAGRLSIESAKHLLHLPKALRVPAIERAEQTGEKVRKVAKQITNEHLQKAVPLPHGKFNTIVVDPPWPVEKIEREVRPNQFAYDYPTMSVDELRAFPLPDLASDDCHLYLWATQKYLPTAFELMETWAFRYVFTMVWHKPGGFQPYGLPQYNTEFVLFGRKGHQDFLDTKNFATGFAAPRREHSRKPDEFYELVKRVSPGPRIDMFSREAHDGFEQYGNEPAKFNGR